MYGWFAAAALLGAFRNAHFYVSLPIRESWYELWALVPLQWMSVALVIFAFRLCGHRYPRLELALMLGALVWAIACALSDQVLLIDLGYLALTLLSLATIGYLAVQCWKAPKLERVLLLVAAIVTQVFGILDFALLLGLRPGESRVYLMPYSVLLFSAVIGAVLVDAFAKARSRSRNVSIAISTSVSRRASASSTKSISRCCNWNANAPRAASGNASCAIFMTASDRNWSVRSNW